MLLSQIVGIVLLVPFFGWAIFLLRRRFQYYEENTLSLEVLTAIALGIFMWIEVAVLRRALDGQMLLYLFAVLGLSVSAFALYAHVIISLASRILVDLVTPAEVSASHQPRFGPVDALERNEDYEGALQEYLVLARIYPRNFEVLSRTARVQEILGDPGEAAAWYLRARKRASKADEALAAVNHLCKLYDQQLDRPEESDALLAQFIRDYPDSPDRMIVMERLERRASQSGFSISSFLESLEETPLEVPAESERLRTNVAGSRGKSELVLLAAAGAAEHPIVAAEPTREARPARASKSVTLDPLGSAKLSGGTPASMPEARGDSAAPKAARPALEPLETAAPEPSAPDSTEQAPKAKPRITLESMDS